MPLASTRDLLVSAQTAGYGVPAFNVIGLEHAEAIVCGAEIAAAPVILQVSENTVAYHFGVIEPIARACVTLGENAHVPVALHLDHATTEELCTRAVACGFSSIMFDTTDLPFADNVAQIAKLAEWAHKQGVAIEAGLGVVGGKDGAVTTVEGMTDPEAARLFVSETGVDALAVAIGTSHSMSERSASIDVPLLVRIRAVVDVPLVLHGSSGVPDDDLAAAVQHGVTKVNLATQLNVAFSAAIRRVLTADPAIVDPRRYLAVARQTVSELVADRLCLLGAGGRA